MHGHHAAPPLPPALAGLGIAGATADSRQVKPGFVFVAVPGARADGRRFIAQAVQAGAIAVVAPTGTEWPADVPPRILAKVAEPRQVLAQLAAHCAGAQPDIVAAVTGTNGKTSTVEFLRQIWALGGQRAASLGTIGVRAPGWHTETGLTTPDAAALHETLARLAREGVDRVAMEASSHGLDQYRLDGVRLAAGGFTNLTRDHLDYHGDLARYRDAKLRLFRDLLPPGAPAVAAADMDADTMAALRAIARDRRLDLRTVGEQGSAIRVLRAVPRPDGQVLEVEAGHTHRAIELPLPGRFQADNALLAACLAHALGQRDALDHLPGLQGVRGRMELAARLPNGAAVYVDYAHTPDAITRLLGALRPHTAGKLLIVFGAGGDRDRGKRPLMGAAACALSDGQIVTDDNPRSENPARIRAEVIAGCAGSQGHVWNVDGREQAIATALNALGPGDVLAVAGKGHENGQTIGDHTLPFDDVTVVRKLVGLLPRQQGAA